MAQIACQIAFEAGELLKSGYGTEFDKASKTLPNDVVTHYDFASEHLILAQLTDKFPTHSFLSEESGETGRKDAEIKWMIDPLDGTVNFSRHVPLFCVSIAACRNDQVLCGAIYAPILAEMFAADWQKGAFFNGKPLQVSTTEVFQTTYAATSLSFNLHQNPNRSIDTFTRMAHQGFPLRALGSTALNLAYVAAGRFDAYWSIGESLNPWDTAAGVLLVEEAFGKVTACSGNPFILSQESTLLATNGKVHDAYIKHLARDL